MEPGHERAVQRVRAVLLAALMLALAAGAHVVGGGDLPDPLLLVLLASLALAAASALGRRRLRRRTLVPALVLAQALLHTAFASLAEPTGTVQDAGASHVHGAVMVSGGADAAVATASLGMPAAHALAAGATALVAVSADRAWAAAVAWLTHLFPALAVLLTGPVTGRGPRVRRTTRTRRPAHLLVVLRRRPRRGPPRALPAV